jgi:hypothetical protein
MSFELFLASRRVAHMELVDELNALMLGDPASPSVQPPEFHERSREFEDVVLAPAPVDLQVLFRSFIWFQLLSLGACASLNEGVTGERRRGLVLRESFWSEV